MDAHTIFPTNVHVGEGIRKWVEIFYNNVESTILNNGFATN